MKLGGTYMTVSWSRSHSPDDLRGHPGQHAVPLGVCQPSEVLKPRSHSREGSYFPAFLWLVQSLGASELPACHDPGPGLGSAIHGIQLPPTQAQASSSICNRTNHLSVLNPRSVSSNEMDETGAHYTE